MNPEQEWDQIRNARPSALGVAGMGLLRVALLFGSAAIALALIIAPLADSYTKTEISDSRPTGLDMTSTGSVGQRGAYTIRRSVLQASPDSVCIIRANGTPRGDC